MMLSIQKTLAVCCLLSCSVLASALPTFSVTATKQLCQTVSVDNKSVGSKCGPGCAYVAHEGCVC